MKFAIRNLRFEFSIARRLYGHRADQQRVSRPATVIAMWGVAVGLAVMIVSVCVILGFKTEIRQKVIGFGGEIQVINYESLYSADSQPVVMDELLVHRLQRLPGVRHVQRFAVKTGMLKTATAFKGIALRGVDEDYDTSFLTAHLVDGRLPHFSSDTTHNEVVLSALIARELGLRVGEKVFAYFFSDKVKARRYTIVGLYETHLREFDNTLVFTDLDAVRRLAGWDLNQCSGVELMVNDFEQLDATAASVVSLVNRTQDVYGATYSAHTIRELYPGIFSWLAVLDTNVYVILALMLALSLFTMTSGLLIIILERTRFIAIMKSLGATDGQLRRVFLHFAVFIIGRGLLYGNLLGIGLALLQQQTGLVHLDPATYYVHAVPILFSWPLIVVLNVACLLLTVCVLIIPTHLVSRIEPARVMRFE